MKMLTNYLRQLIKPNYNTLNRIEINQTAILNNLKIIQSEQANSKIIPVLKSNAYGHGLKEIATILNKSNVEMVAVDSFPEAQIVYQYFKKKVLIMGEMPAAVYKFLDWKRTEVCIYSSYNLQNLMSLKRKINIHLFINTGMNREGINDIQSFLQKNENKFHNLRITGLCSHLSNAETSDGKNREQLRIFLESLDLLEKKYKTLKYIHLANSAGVFSLHHHRLNTCRPGLAVYGINPFKEGSPYFQKASLLLPVMSVYSTVIALQEIKAGDSVSYNNNYQAKKDLKIAVIPFGYYEGLDRRLSNTGQFKLGADYVKVAGSICMNMTCLELGNKSTIKTGQEIQIISAKSEDLNSVVQLARIQKTISHEILIGFRDNIRKIIVDK
ncbi:MAG: alanine racemase [Clostridia bacterium]|nr:alanine racemase [Clostridia bacterium]